MLSRDVNLQVFARACDGADLAVIEGVMGLFDGRSAASEEGSTAEMAKWLGAPVLLAADASAMARSAAALVRGFEDFDPDLKIAGVVFNRIGGEKHAEILRDAVSASCRSRTIGCLPRNPQIAIPDRHLGLTMAAESLSSASIDEMVAWIEKHLDLDALLSAAREKSPELRIADSDSRPRCENKARIGVARDAAFCFYYQDNLDLLAESGAELVEFSPLADPKLPSDIHGIYIGGGYPELHAAGLARNESMRESIRRFAAKGSPIYAECGGFMYLTEAIVDANGVEHPMVGLFPTRAKMQARFAALGYREAESDRDILWLREGERMRGHEFRYSTIDSMPGEIARVYKSPAEAYRIGRAIGTYIHLHFRSCPGFAERFVRECAER